MLILRPLGKFVVATAVGALLDYLLDPKAGPGRRARILSQIRQIVPGDHSANAAPRSIPT